MPSSLNLRKLTGSATIANVTISPAQIYTVAITVTGAASGDTATVNFNTSGGGTPCIGAIVVTTNTVTAQIVQPVDDLNFPSDATWGTLNVTAKIIK